MKTKLLLSILFTSFLLVTNLNAQQPSFDWAYNTGGLYGTLYNGSMILDDMGNIYSIGLFNGGPVDFDPGSDVLNLSSVGETDIYVTKLDASGGFIWAKRFGGPEKNEGTSIAVDISGNVYFTGNFAGVADFNTGSDVHNLTSGGGSDIFVCKLDYNGNFLWAKQVGGASDDKGTAIAVDSYSNVYVSGYFQQTVDFDPSAETGKLTSNGIEDIFICKFNTSGDFQWVKQVGSAGYDRGEALIIDSSSNLFLTGSFTGTVDFDPGDGVTELISTGATGFVLKLNASGDYEWAAALPNNITGYAIAIDAPGNIFIGGGGPGIGVIKLNATGVIIWEKFLSGFNCSAKSVAVDALGNVYTTGSFRNEVDFDPGEGTVIFDSGYGWDAYVNKFDASGNYIWAYQLGGPTQRNHGVAIALDVSGSIYASGYFRSSIDFDPGPDSFTLSSEFNYNAYLLKWNQTTVGITENTFTENIQVYPNPTSGNFAIKFETIQNDLSVRIMSLSGQTIETHTFQNTDFVQLKLEQPNGIYLVELLNSEGNKTVFRLIKK